MINQNTFSILPLTSPLAATNMAGGKGANLMILAQAGFQVPPGSIIPTTAYQKFIETNRLEPTIQTTLNGIDVFDPVNLEKASQTIRTAFASGKMPEEIRSRICESYIAFGQPAVAVRSSATCEDLPELSFAGQQDTYLNVISEEVLIRKVIECWSSLWTARSIGYRVHQNVPQDGIMIAVVIQKMVESEASGVLFTANPLTGLRSEAVIDAAPGLGEALVSGLVEPDHYAVDIVKNKIRQKTLGSKKISIRSAEDGGVKQITEKPSEYQALKDDQILFLAKTGQKVEEHFGVPQDIEWCFCKGQLYLLQSRPITSLFPLPVGLPAEPLKIFLSFANIQGMMDPITPIGQSALKSIFAEAGSLVGIHKNEKNQTILFSAGERLWINITSVMKNSLGRKIIPVVLEFIEPTIRQAVLQIQDDPLLLPGKRGLSFHACLQLLRFILPVAGNAFLNILSPSRRRKMLVNNGENILKKMDLESRSITGNRFTKLAGQVELLQQILKKDFPHMMILFVSGIASGMAAWNILSMLTRKINGNKPGNKTRWSNMILEITRGLPYNPTTEMDLALWKMAQSIRLDPASMQVMLESSPVQLSQDCQNGNLPFVLTGEIHRFLERYGGRGFGEIDLGRTRWAENPTHVFEMLSSFLQIKDPNNAPDVVFNRSANSAAQAVEQLTTAIRKTSNGFLKAILVQFFAGRARQLMGMRESPKFFIVRMMWIFQRELKKTGQEFVEAGELDNADDLFFLTFPELSALADGFDCNWREIIMDRRERYQKERRRRQVPRLLISDGRTFYEGMNTSTGQENADLIGSPVSPGIVEGPVRIVLNPGNAGLIPGEILVCPGTDPSWTPLFMVASGLVMEVGGMMTHGAVVAREYGIPAVVGVTKATTRLITGRRIRFKRFQW